MATSLTRSWARRFRTGNSLLQGEVVLQQGPHPAGHRHDADLGLLAVGAALAPDPELALLPEDVLGGQVAQLADAEAGVEQGPDDELLGGRLAGVGEAVGLLGGEGLADVLVGHCSPRTLRLIVTESAMVALSVIQATPAAWGGKGADAREIVAPGVSWPVGACEAGLHFLRKGEPASGVIVKDS